MEESILRIQTPSKRREILKRPKLFSRIGRSYSRKNPLDQFKLVAKVLDKN